MEQDELKQENFQRKFLEVLNECQIDKEILNRSSIEELFEDISVFHQELVYQNQELRRIQEELTVSKQHYVDLFENAPVGYVVFNEDNIIESANTSFARLIGIPVGDLKGVKITQFIAPNSQDSFFIHTQHLFKTGIPSSINLSINLPQATKTVILDSNRLRDGEKILIRGAVTDITNEIRYQGDLKERVKELNCLLKISTLTNNGDKQTDEILQEVIAVAVASFQFSERVGMQISIGEKVLSSDHFNSNSVRLKEPIMQANDEVGQIVVSSSSSESGSEELLQEERDLVAAIGRQISLFVTKQMAYDKLLEREHYYRTILHGLHEGIVVIDRNYVITDVNNNFVNNSGKGRDEILGRKCYDITHGVDKPCNSFGEECELMTVFKTGESCSYIHEHVGAQGEKIFVDIILSPVFDEQGHVSHVVEATRDVSELLLTQRAIQDSEEKHRLLVTQMPQGLALHEVVRDNDGKVVDYRFTDVNNGYERITGLTREQIINKTVREVIPDIEQFWIDAFGKVATTGEPVSLESFSKPLEKFFKVHAYSPAKDQFAVIVNDITQEKKLQANLIQSEERYRSLFENSHAAMLIIDPQSGGILDANPAAVEFYGWNRELLIGMNIGNINTLPVNELSAQLAQAEAGKQRYFVFQHRIMDGSTRDVEVFSGPIKFNNQTVLYSLIHDITDKLKAEEALIISEQRHRKLAESTKTIFWEFDLVADRWAYLSPQVEKFLGFAPNQWSNFEFWANRIHPDDRDTTIYTCKLATMKGQDHEMEYRFMAANGNLVWIREEVNVELSNGKPFWLRGTMMDITTRKFAEIALKHSEEKFQSLFNHLSVGVSLLSKDMKVVQVNPQISKWFPDADFSTNPFCYCAFGHPTPGKPCPDCPVLKTFADGKTYETEHEMYSPLGKMIYRVVSTPILNDRGEVEAVVEMLDNVTERKKAQDALRESEHKYRMLFETMEQGVVYQDEKGFIVSANGAAQRILGLSLDQMQGRTSAHPEWRAITEEGEILRGDQHPAMIALNTGKSVTGQVMGVYHPTSKEHKWILVNAIPEFIENCEKPYRVYATFTDITERKKYEHQIKEQKDFLETLMQTLPNPVFYKGTDGKYIGCNKAFEAFMGFSLAQIVGKSVFDIAPSHLAQSYSKKDDELLATLNTQSYESIVQTVADERRSVIFDKAPLIDSKGKPMGIIGVITDITERKRAEEENLINAQRLKAIVRIFEQKVGSTSELLSFALNESLYLTNSKVGFVYLHDMQTGEFKLKSWAQHRDAEVPQPNPRAVFTSSNAGILSAVVNDGKELVVNNHTKEVNIDIPRDQAYLSRVISIPITDNGRVIAVVGVANKELDYNETDLNQLKLLMASVWGMLQRRADAEKISMLSVAVEQSSASIVITNKKGTIEYVNPKFSQITGYSLQEAIGQNPRVLNSGFHDKNFFKDLWATILAGKEWRGQLVNRKKNGDLYWESASISPVKNGKGNIINFIAVKEDITEIKKAEEALRDSELKLRRMIEQSPDGIVLADETGKVVSWNKAIESVTHIPSDVAMGMFIWDFHKMLPSISGQPPSIEMLKRVSMDLLSTGKSSYFATNVVHDVSFAVNNTPTYIQLTVFVIPIETRNMIACFVRDITPQKKAELAVQEREERLQAIFDNSIQSFVIFSPRLRVQAFNHVAKERAKHLFNSDFEVGKSIFEIYPPEFTRLLKSFADNVLAGETSKFEVPVTDSAGNNFWFELHFSPVFDDKRQVNGIFFNSIDITQRKLAEESMTRSLEKEKELSDLKSRFVSTVSHEFRTPLASIYSNSQLLHRYHTKWDEEKKNQSFMRIYDSVNMMTGMLENVSLIGKEQSGRFTFRPESLNLNEFAARIVEESHLTLNTTNRVQLSIQGDFTHVLLDQVLLRHILVNIISNAIKYSPNAKPVEFVIQESKRFIEFSVQDFGVGIPENDINKIFDPFFRATNSEDFSGTGLGMTIVKQCVDTHGGSVEVSSILGSGTLVKVWLPHRTV